MNTFYNLIDWFFDARMLMLNHQIQFLKEQNLVLREHLPQKRLIFTQRQKQRLLRFDKLLGCKAKELLTIVHTTTWYRWKRERYNIPNTRFGIGRPPKITDEIRKLVAQMVKANHLWGYPSDMQSISRQGDFHLLKNRCFNDFLKNKNHRKKFS